jgi:putative ABC transport system substrate-binding protein
LVVAGFTEGKNLIIDERVIGVRPDKFASVARELALSNVAVFICASGAPAISGARQATKTVPIVGQADNMVQEGYVESLANGSGNTKGVSILADELDGKRQRPAAGRAADQVQAGDQSESRPRDGYHRAGTAPAARRRGGGVRRALGVTRKECGWPLAKAHHALPPATALPLACS